MDSLVLMLASYGLCFGLMNDKAPWLTGRLRALPLLEREDGTLFTRQLACAYCTGFHTGWVTWLMDVLVQGLPTSGLLGNVSSMAVWALASSTSCYVLDVAVQRLESHASTS